MLDLASIRRRFAVYESTPPGRSRAGARQAAVAVVLRERRGATEVLFIQRAERDGDPWSGHMAFPGGHREPDDADLRAAAVRETREEIGLDISSVPLLGALPEQCPVSARRDIRVAPFVFEIHGDPPLALNYEVAAAVWAPLGPMYRGDNAARSRPLPSAGPGPDRTPVFDGFRLAGGHFIWGLTYRMVQTFFEALDPGYQRLPG